MKSSSIWTTILYKNLTLGLRVYEFIAFGILCTKSLNRFFLNKREYWYSKHMIKIELSQQDVKQNDPVYFLLKNISLFLLKAGSQKCQNNALCQRLKPREFIELWRGTVQMPSFVEASVQGHSKIFKFWEKIYWHFGVLIFLLKLLQQFSFYIVVLFCFRFFSVCLIMIMKKLCACWNSGTRSIKNSIPLCRNNAIDNFRVRLWMCRQLRLAA